MTAVYEELSEHLDICGTTYSVA